LEFQDDEAEAALQAYSEQILERLQIADAAVAAFDAVLIGDQKHQKIEVAPGFQLYGFLTSIVPKKFAERELAGMFADAQADYLERLAAGDFKAAKRIRYSMLTWMLWTVSGGSIGLVASAVFGKSKLTK